MTRLFETDHPYYAQEGNYYSSDCHMEYSSWQDFLDEQGDDDMDMNFVYRWDWQKFDESDYIAEELAEMDDEEKSDVLQLFYIGQRKAIARSVFVVVTDEDEPQIREWLKTRAAHMRLTWFPLLEEEA